MISRLIRFTALVLLAFGMTPAVSQTAPLRIVAVGDLHGDYDAWIAIARDAGLIGTDNKWRGGRTTFVQTGDIVDRGPDSLKIIRHLQQLDREAKAAGGRVVVLMGNHEAMMVTGDLRYVHPGEYAAFADSRSAARREAAYKANRDRIEASYRTVDGSMSPAAIKEAWIKDTPLGKLEHNTAWGPNGELGKWVATLPAVAKVGDSLFVHGGLNGQYALIPLIEINRRAKAAVEAGDPLPTVVINDENGPLWYRGLATGTGSGGRSAESELDAALKVNDVARMVVGHTPDRSGVRIHFGGKLVLVDSAISAYYGGALGWIEIRGGTVVPHIAKRGR